MRSTRWAALMAAIALSVTAGCAGISASSDLEAAVDDDAATESTEPQRGSSEGTTDEPAEPETTEPAAELGTRESPAAVESDVATFTVADDEINVTLGAANWDAEAVVLGENEYQDPPADGMVFVILPVTASYTGPDSMLPWLDIEVTFLADNGRSYEDTYGMIPDELMDVADIYDGATATGNLLFELPADQVPGGLWGVSYNWSDPLWWTAA